MRRILVCAIAINAILSSAALPQYRNRTASLSRNSVRMAVALWREPSDIRTRNLFHGPGGQAGQPRAPFRFVEEDRSGSNPKFVVRDARGVLWKVKLGNEAQPETTATRLLWAVGYFTDTTYYLPRIKVAGLPKLSRGQKFVSGNGTVNGARLERAVNKMSDWSWFDNPFLGTKEFDGLRVMMALMNNWDLKQANNGIYDVRGQGHRYLVNDLGGTFGKTGGDWARSRGNLEHYIGSRFIEEITPTSVDLVLHSRPPALYAVAVPYYVQRVRMEKVSEDIPRAHARWIGQWLARLSTNQIRDAFRAAGYTPAEVQGYARKVRERIMQLNAL